jgi:hypothetical protein
MSMPGDMQEKMRLGDTKDIYYYNSKTLEKQAIATVQDTRFNQAINNLKGGSSTFIISPDEGVSDIIVGVKLPAHGSGGVDYRGLALSKAWIYRLIKNCSIRYGGSSQYFFTGTQMFVQNMRECSNPSSKQKLVDLGGQFLACSNTDTSGGDFQGDGLYAYAVLNLPHSTTNASLEKCNPFPSEAMNQPIVITLELNNVASIFKKVASPNGTAPTELAEGYFQVRQVHAVDRGQLMRPTANGEAYSFPLKAFYQNEIAVPLDATTTQQSVVLTGFRQGDVRSIFFWIEDTLDTNNPYNWILPRDVKLIYNGTVYQDYKGISSQIWDLLGTDVPSYFENGQIDISASTIYVSKPQLTNWVNLPFSQIYEQLSGTHLMVKGKEINNATVNIQLSLPSFTGATDRGRFVLHAVYAYNSVLLVSGGSAEYVF